MWRSKDNFWELQAGWVFLAISAHYLVSQVLGLGRPRASRQFCGLHHLFHCWDVGIADASVSFMHWATSWAHEVFFVLFFLFSPLIPIIQGQKLRLRKGHSLSVSHTAKPETKIKTKTPSFLTPNPVFSSSNIRLASPGDPQLPRLMFFFLFSQPYDTRLPSWGITSCKNALPQGLSYPKVLVLGKQTNKQTNSCS